jgi:hypothetical protein
MWSCEDRDDANRFVHVLLRVHVVSFDSEAASRRLLRLLFVWIGQMPARSAAGEVLRVDAVDPKSCDSVRKPAHVLMLWVIPGVVALGSFVGATGIPALLLLGGVACLAMGVACLINAARCQRLHCYFSGPYFLALALAAGVAFFLDSRNAYSTREWVLLALCVSPILIWLPERLAGTTYRKNGRVCH